MLKNNLPALMGGAARVALMLGESEVAAQQVVVKDLRNGEQENAGASGCCCASGFDVGLRRETPCGLYH